MRSRKKYLVKHGLSTLEHPMTIKQAERYARNAMPEDLKRSGFRESVCLTDREISGGEWLRVSYTKIIDGCQFNYSN